VTESFEIVPLSAEHDRCTFSCGVDALDQYLRRQASQDMRRRIANCFVAIFPPSNTVVAGYYTLSAASVPIAEMPAEQTRHLPRYPVLPAALVGRLAIDRGYAGRGIGSALLFDALRHAIAADPAIFAIIVDAKDVRSADFYRHFGFQPFRSRPMSFFLPLATAIKLEK
jgi:GNAT superfamily N-acetyltransferase